MGKFRVVLDPGHGGKSRANVGPTGYIEADGVLDISLKVRELLKDYKDIDVFMSREEDETLDSGPRISKVNSFKGDIVISIHTNAGPKEAAGTDVFYSINQKPGSKGHSLASLLVKYVCEYAGTKNRGIKTRKSETNSSLDYYFMIREIKTTSVIIECAFHTNPIEEQLLKTDEFRMKCAKGIVRGIVEFFELKWNEETSPSVLYKVYLDGKQIGAFAVRDNAYRLAENYDLSGNSVIEIKENDSRVYIRSGIEDYKTLYEQVVKEKTAILDENTGLKQENINLKSEIEALQDKVNKALEVLK